MKTVPDVLAAIAIGILVVVAIIAAMSMPSRGTGEKTTTGPDCTWIWHGTGLITVPPGCL